MNACHQRLNASCTKKTTGGVWTMRQGAGAQRTFGTPCGRQLASGSSFHLAPDARTSYSAFAHGWNGTGSFTPFARSRMYPSGGFHTPDRSGLPSGSRGVGALKFTLPSGVRGAVDRGRFVHWADSDTPSMITNTSGCSSVFMSNLL